MLNDSWWAVARSEEVTGEKPLSVDVGNQPVVLWRDAGGTARALEDRCPHRRAPLSRGCVHKEGWIQCGYHGWSYSGETGRVMQIPNLKDRQGFSQVYRAERYAVHESAGFVRVNLRADATPPTDRFEHLPLSGTSHVALDHDRYVAALFDDPSLLLDIRGVRFTTYLFSELQLEGGLATMERSCQFKVLHWPAPFASEYPMTWLTRTDPATGETQGILRDRNLQRLLTTVLAPVPAARGITAIRWRASVGDALSRIPGRVLDVLHPLRVRESIDAAALRQLLPSVSIRFEELRPSPAISPVESVA